MNRAGTHTPYQDSGNAGGPSSLVTRNVPPKRVRVNDQNTVSWNEKTYSAGEPLTLPGPMADQLAFGGHVVVEDHDVDGTGAEPVDVTQHRQELGQRHLAENRKMTAKEGGE